MNPELCSFNRRTQEGEPAGAFVNSNSSELEPGGWATQESGPPRPREASKLAT